MTKSPLRWLRKPTFHLWNVDITKLWTCLYLEVKVSVISIKKGKSSQISCKSCFHKTETVLGYMHLPWLMWQHWSVALLKLLNLIAFLKLVIFLKMMKDCRPVSVGHENVQRGLKQIVQDILFEKRRVFYFCFTSVPGTSFASRKLHFPFLIFHHQKEATSFFN